ncbi:extracellular calcium-sensing receptor-like [Haplochromis burtoni]|uniref:extracellular calcium-sensing receptor-like n=1 Tax=Haplochromis burtoni TaxID=8153 RepID=UPI001C2D24EC|nr:extracellular calcium-sensing receptor-like [Haplochromis burtoni]
MTSTQRWPEKGWALLQLLLVASASSAEEPVCRQRGDPENPLLSKNGDIILGAIFSFHASWKDRKDSYMNKPLPLQCTSLNFRDLQFAQAMLFAIEEINNSTDLLPGISVGYKIYDDCGSDARSAGVTLALANGNEIVSVPSKTPCTRPAHVQAIIGATSSSKSIAVATVIGPFFIPVISYFATCACLSDKTKYPSFLRTIPSDYYQSRALAHLVKYFGWTWVGAIRTNSDYGNNGMATFTETAQQLGICLEYSVSFFRTDPSAKIQRIIDIIKASTSKVIVTFLARADFHVLLREFSYYNLSGYQWIGSETWIFDSRTAEMDIHHILDGAIGLSIPKAHVTGLREFILNEKPLNSSNNELFTEFWETLFSCKFKELKSSSDIQRECTGHEDMTGVQNSFIDMSLMPLFNNVYKGVYAVAHALHNILSCNKTCNKTVQLDPLTVLQHIRKIHFTTKEGDEVHFDENGDPAAKYDIINWQSRENGVVEFVTVGLYNPSLVPEKQLNLQNKSLIWARNSKQVSYRTISLFLSTRPGSNVKKWFGQTQQRLCVTAFTLIQVNICIIWLTTSPPFPFKNFKEIKDKITLECALGSVVGFWAVLGYIGLLAILCFIFAFLARKLPDNFNEAKFITFSMLIFCAVWITFVPSYVSSPGKFSVAVEIFAILASSFGLLICIFIPKCYIILMKPEKNTKKYVMGKKAPNSL